jgi:REP element-mobilizing transposase RayT
MVVLPDHLHTAWTMPEGDADFATRWRLIKSASVARMSGSDIRVFLIFQFPASRCAHAGYALEIQYLGLNKERFKKSICLARFSGGGMEIADPEDCKKQKEK